MISSSLKNVTYTYPHREKPAISNISINIEKGSFVVISGVSGSGKSTLGKVMKGIIPGLYGGILRGWVNSEEIGYVLQDPEKQMLMTTVEMELAFGMENISVAYPIMRKRVAEILDYIGMSDLRNANTRTLSGGKQQKLSIGCALGMGYKTILLDEPLGQLDPVGSSEIVGLLKRLNEDMGITVIIIEQKIDILFEAADRIIFLDDGAMVFDGTPKEFIASDVAGSNLVLSDLMLSFKNIFSRNIIDDLPLSIRSARKILEKFEVGGEELPMENQNFQEEIACDDSIIRAEKLIFSYDTNNTGKNAHLKIKDFKVKKGEIIGVIGENGSGKSTFLKLLSGILKPQKGILKLGGKIGYLSQNPNDYFFEATLRDEIAGVLYVNKLCWDMELDEKLEILGMTNLLSCNPRELSGGEGQRAALSTVLAGKPDILLLDEPTRGLNKGLKRNLKKLLRALKETGLTIIIVSHDMALIGDLTEKSAVISGGKLEIMDCTRKLLSEGVFYVSDVGKLFHSYGMNIVKSEEGEAVLLNLRKRC